MKRPDKVKFHPIACLICVGDTLVELSILLINLLSFGRIGYGWAIEYTIWRLSHNTVIFEPKE